MIDVILGCVIGIIIGWLCFLSVFIPYIRRMIADVETYKNEYERCRDKLTVYEENELWGDDDDC